jgi:competence protein ComFC
MNLWEKIISYFFPPTCLHCGREGYFVCPDCVKKITSESSQKELKLQYFEKVLVFAEWENPLMKKAIKQLKFQYAKSILDELQTFFEKTYPEQKIPANAHFIPVPLHPLRKNKRGFNQSELLAQMFSQIFCQEVRVSNLLYRSRHTEHQSHLNRTERLTNLTDAFRIYPDVAKKIPLSTPLVLVDDVVTTGSTLVECAKVLKEHGYEHIYGVVIA